LIEALNFGEYDLVLKNELGETSVPVQRDMRRTSEVGSLWNIFQMLIYTSPILVSKTTVLIKFNIECLD